MSKSPEAFRTIGEVSELLDIPAHVLRFWESRFTQIRPVKRAGGRRYYRPTDVALLAGIRRLLHDQGMTIRGVQKLLRDEGVRHVCALAEPDLAEEASTELAQEPVLPPPVVAPPEPALRVIPWPGPRDAAPPPPPDAGAAANQPAPAMTKAPVPVPAAVPPAAMAELPLFAGLATPPPPEERPDAPAMVAGSDTALAPRVLVARLLQCEPGVIPAARLLPLRAGLQALRDRIAAAATTATAPRGRSGI